MMAGAAVLLAGVIAAVAMASTGIASWAVTAPIWFVIGAGMALIVTPTGRVIRSSVRPPELPAAFAAQFSLSHLAWLITYPIAGWMGTSAGLTPAWITLAALAAAGMATATAVWRRNPSVRETSYSRVEASAGELSRSNEAEAAEGTLAACQCSSVRPV